MYVILCWLLFLPLAEILCVANVFDSLEWNAEPAQRMDRWEALKYIKKRSGTFYNKFVVDALEKVVRPFPVTSLVKINNSPNPNEAGKVGVVMALGRDNEDQVELQLIFDENGQKIEPIYLKISNIRNYSLEMQR
jgi:hypothetical protein